MKQCLRHVENYSENVKQTKRILLGQSKIRISDLKKQTFELRTVVNHSVTYGPRSDDPIIKSVVVSLVSKCITNFIKVSISKESTCSFGNGDDCVVGDLGTGVGGHFTSNEIYNNFVPKFSVASLP